MKRSLFFLLMVITLTGCSRGEPVSHVYAFGDGLSDNGNLYQFFKDDQDTLHVEFTDKFYWEGRASNGPVAVEVLAEKLKVGLSDYAYVLAGSGLANHGVQLQVQEYIASTKAKGETADPNALYFIFPANEGLSYVSIGSEFIKSNNPEEFGDTVMENIVKSITALAEFGAKRFMMVELIDLSKEPLLHGSDIPAESVEFATRLENHIHGNLPGKMEALAEELGVSILVFDYPAESERIRSNAGKYELTNLDDPCVLFTYKQDSDELPTGVICTSPDSYYFWDEVRPTRRVHELMGEAMFKSLNQ